MESEQSGGLDFSALEKEFSVDRREINKDETTTNMEAAFNGIQKRSESQTANTNIFHDAQTIVIGHLEDTLTYLPPDLHDNNKEVQRLQNFEEELGVMSRGDGHELDQDTRARLAAFFRGIRASWENPPIGVTNADAKAYRDISSQILTELYKGLPIPEAVIGEAPNSEGPNRGLIHIEEIIKYLRKENGDFTLDDAVGCFNAIKDNFADDSNHELRKQRHVVEKARQVAEKNVHKKGYAKPVVTVNIDEYNNIPSGIKDEELDSELDRILEIELFDEEKDYLSEPADGKKLFVLDMYRPYVKAVQDFDNIKDASVPVAAAVEKMKNGEHITDEEAWDIGKFLARLEENKERGSMEDDEYDKAVENFGKFMDEQVNLALAS